MLLSGTPVVPLLVVELSAVVVLVVVAFPELVPLFVELPPT